jgi:hypothetical protein
VTWLTNMLATIPCGLAEVGGAWRVGVVRYRKVVRSRNVWVWSGLVKVRDIVVVEGWVFGKKG